MVSCSGTVRRVRDDGSREKKESIGYSTPYGFGTSYNPQEFRSVFSAAASECVRLGPFCSIPFSVFEPTVMIQQGPATRVIDQTHRSARLQAREIPPSPQEIERMVAADDSGRRAIIHPPGFLRPSFAAEPGVLDPGLS